MASRVILSIVQARISNANIIIIRTKVSFLLCEADFYRFPDEGHYNKITHKSVSWYMESKLSLEVTRICVYDIYDRRMNKQIRFNQLGLLFTQPLS